MSSDLVREIVYEDDEVVAYADYDLAGRINYEEDVNLWIVNKDYEHYDKIRLVKENMGVD